MILNTIMDNGKMGYQMEMPMHIITMGMFIKETFKKVKDKALDHMFSIKFIDMKVNGEIILSQEKESFSEMVNYFLKVCFKMDWSMVTESINMKMVTFFKEITSKIKSVAEADTIFTKEEFCNLNSTLVHLKSLEFS